MRDRGSALFHHLFLSSTTTAPCRLAHRPVKRAIRRRHRRRTHIFMIPSVLNSEPILTTNPTWTTAAGIHMPPTVVTQPCKRVATMTKATHIVSVSHPRPLAKRSMSHAQLHKNQIPMMFTANDTRRLQSPLVPLALARLTQRRPLSTITAQQAPEMRTQHGRRSGTFHYRRRKLRISSWTSHRNLVSKEIQ